MKKYPFSLTSFISWHSITLLALCFGIGIRIYLYLYHKDLWLDEAMLSFSLFGISFGEIFFQPLPHTQAAPLGFLLITKLGGLVFGYGEYWLYFMPLLCGIGSLLLAYRIGAILFDNFGQCFFVLLCVGSMSLLYYSTEFKQYGLEAFCAFLAIYLYLTAGVKRLCIAAVVMMFFSNTIIFIWGACVVGYAYQNRSHLITFIKQNFFSLLLPCVVFLIYYVLYIRFQAVSGFYDYWDKYFLPHHLSEYPAFFKDTLLSLYSGFAPFGENKGNKNIILVYMGFSLLGLFAMYKQKAHLCVVVISALVIYIALSWFRIYPFGHGGVIGSRLSLWMSVIFYLCCAYGVYALYKQKIWLKSLAVILLLTCLFQAIYHESRHIRKNQHHIQQTHAFVDSIANNIQEGDCVWVYRKAAPAFNYYSFIDHLSIPYEVIDNDLSSFTFDAKNCTSHYVFATHYPIEWYEELRAIIENYDPHASWQWQSTGWGVFLVQIHTQDNSVR
uniref:Glycosyltransferase RgtA/B/C/D-like domain-containing protein n=1 Tax=uncultured Helicobacter sp. TaxID=175537 RepID=A0A650EKX4_9HELI|nr:hypothetical protein Helico6505_0580 [uncultured Helicobacter sp.]